MMFLDMLGGNVTVKVVDLGFHCMIFEKLSKVGM